MTRATERAYSELQQAFDFYNQRPRLPDYVPARQEHNGLFQLQALCCC